jgi:hypothetical protein
VFYEGLGFDTCTAPSVSQMTAWLSSPYRAVGIYIGGINRTCAQTKLSAAWVSQVENLGWRLAPVYKGLQSPTVDNPSQRTIDPAGAAVQGRDAARDAMAQAQALGLGPGTPLYYDMESYGPGASTTVLTFLGAWTVELHAQGYLSGLYGNSNSAMADESTAWGTSGQVDEIWFARWSGIPNTFNDAYIANDRWPNHQRMHQYRGDHPETYGGVTINIDTNVIDARLVGMCTPQAPTCLTPIDQHWLDLGGAGSVLGQPTGPEGVAADGIGRYRAFAGGTEFWSPSTGAHEVHGAIRGKYGALGWERSFLGYPLTDETPTADRLGRFNHFQYGSIYWTSATGAWEVHGAVRAEWAKLGWERSVLGYPTTDEKSLTCAGGRYNNFQGGAITWSPATGAHETHGAIRARWASLGFECGTLGLPVTDETPTPDGTGRFNHFQYGSIYWTPATGAWEVHGAIRGHWAALGWERSFLGYPVTNELAVGDGVGRYNHFQGGYIYWSPASGAWSVKGAILGRYQSLGGPWSRLGYPVTDETPTSYGARSTFQHGHIDWYSGTGTVIVGYT